MDAADLKAFSDELIRRAKYELGSMVEAARKERMLSKAEVKELFGVCDATLWHWDRKGILKPVKTGNKVLYPCLLYTSPSPRDRQKSRMPSSA